MSSNCLWSLTQANQRYFCRTWANFKIILGRNRWIMAHLEFLGSP